MIPSENRIEISVKGATSVLLGVKGLRHGEQSWKGGPGGGHGGAGGVTGATPGPEGPQVGARLEGAFVDVGGHQHRPLLCVQGTTRIPARKKKKKTIEIK